jgi:uncharacterized protein (DUF305 family)
MTRHLSLVAALAVAVMSTVAPIAAQDAAGGTMHHAMPMTDQDAAAELQHGMATMMHDMNAMPSTGNPDQDFAAMMIVHHRGAIEMATVQLKYGTDPQMRKLAEEVIAAQKKEIAFMESWLAKQPR